jgi:hypothetical protein
MTCEQECPLEQETQDDVSPGVVQDEETLCRGAFGKKAHYNSSGVKPALIRDRDFLAGELSVWRLGVATLDEVVEQIGKQPPPENALWDVFGITASAVRAIRVPGRAGRVVSVIDDCRVDDAGGKHPAHAVLAVCRSLNLSLADKGSPSYVEIREELYRLLILSVVWALPEGDRA